MDKFSSSAKEAPLCAGGGLIIGFFYYLFIYLFIYLFFAQRVIRQGR